MKIVGCDLHARQQTIAMMDTETGEFTEKTCPGRECGTRVLRGLRRSSGGRHRSHRMRSRVQHTLQAIALHHALRPGRGLWSAEGQSARQALPLPPYTGQRRNELLGLYRQLQKRIQELDKEVEGQARQRPQSCRLMTHSSGNIKSVRCDEDPQLTHAGSTLFRHDGHPDLAKMS